MERQRVELSQELTTLEAAGPAGATGADKPRTPRA